jgi:ADP-ribosylglycohydrolase
MAALVGAIAGVLTGFSTDNVPGAMLAGLGAAGLSVPVLHNLIG